MYPAHNITTNTVSTHPIGPHYISRSPLDSASVRRTQELQMKVLYNCNCIQPTNRMRQRVFCKTYYLLVKFIATSKGMDITKRHYGQVT